MDLRWLQVPLPSAGPSTALTWNALSRRCFNAPRDSVKEIRAITSPGPGSAQLHKGPTWKLLENWVPAPLPDPDLGEWGWAAALLSCVAGAQNILGLIMLPSGPGSQWRKTG